MACCPSTLRTSAAIGVAVLAASADSDEQERRLQLAGCGEVRRIHAHDLDATLRAITSGTTIVLVSLGLLGPPLRSLVSRVAAALDAGIDVITLDEGLVVSSSTADPSAAPFRSMAQLLTTWEQHRTERRRRTIKARQVRAGRKPRLVAEDGARIRAMLDAPGATVPRIARALGVGRTTLYRYLRNEVLPASARLGTAAATGAQCRRQA